MSESRKLNMLLDEQQIKAVKDFFARNPDVTKLSRKQPIFLEDGSEIRLPYSVVKSSDETTPNKEPSFFALFRAYRKNNGEPPVLNDAKSSFGTQKQVYGKGEYGFAKGGQNIETGENVVIKRYFQKHDQDFEELLDNARHEEQGLQKTGKYKGSVVRSFSDNNPQEKDAVYTVMEIVPGKSLKDSFKDIRKLDDETKLKIMLNILEATKYMHSTGIAAHNDLGRQNIMIDGDVDAAIIDFGLSVYTEFPYTLPYSLQQKDSHYLAPESRLGAIALGITTVVPSDLSRTKLHYITSAADIYSLGYEFNRYWLNSFLDKNNRDLEHLVSKMMELFPQNRPSTDECIQFLKSVLILNYLRNNQLEEAKQLLKSSPMVVCYNLELFRICLDQQLVHLNNYNIPDILQEFFRQEIPIDEIIEFINEYQGDLVLSRAEISRYKDILEIQKILLLSGIDIQFDIKFDDNDNNESQILSLCETIANKISQFDNFEKMITTLESIAQRNNELFKNIFLKINIPDNIQTEEPWWLLGMQLQRFISLITNLNEEDKLTFLTNDNNVRFLKKCISEQPSLLLDIARIILSADRQIFLSKFSAQEIQTYVKHFNDFKEIYLMLEINPSLQQQIFEHFKKQGMFKLILNSNDFISACRFFSEPLKSSIINECDFSKVFTDSEDLVDNLMFMLSREEFLRLLENKNFLQAITDNILLNIPKIIDDGMLYMNHNDIIKILSQFFDILVCKGVFTIKDLVQEITKLSEDQRYDFLLQENIQTLIKSSIKDVGDFILILKMVPDNSQREYFISKIEDARIINLFTNSNNDQKKQELLSLMSRSMRQKLLTIQMRAHYVNVEFSSDSRQQYSDDMLKITSRETKNTVPFNSTKRLLPSTQTNTVPSSLQKQTKKGQ